MEEEQVPSHIVEIVEDGWKTGNGYVILGGKNNLVIHYLSEWARFYMRRYNREDELNCLDDFLTDEEVLQTPIRSYTWFVKKAYYQNPEALEKILGKANPEAINELDQIRNEFNALLSTGFPDQETINEYYKKVDRILRA